MKKLKALLSRLKLLLFVYPKLADVEAALLSAAGRLGEVERRLEFIQEALGRVEGRQLGGAAGLPESEYRVFSQWGEDGIIQFLLRHVEVGRKVFVEFGADHYDTESNTRFLLTNNNWAGLVIDGSQENIDRLKPTRAYWLYELKAVRAFITRDNINRLLEENGVSGEIGLLSIDIDGNDYWVWKALDVASPVIVVAEYNYRFGSDRAVTIPYDEGFDRERAHPSKIYYGVSLKALCLLAESKGYAFVGCNSNGVNAFFVRRDRLPGHLRELTAEEGFVVAGVAEVFDRGGEIRKKTPREEMQLLRSLGLPLVDVGEDLKGGKG
jgi:hypothetical protein